jgi:hypothetical protein
MIPVADEMLMAYADGELTPPEQQALEQLLRQDPVLRSRLEPFIHTRMRLSTAFDAALREPVPDRLVEAIRRGPPRQPVKLPVQRRVRSALAGVAATMAPNGFTPALAASWAGLIVVGAAAGWIAGYMASSPVIATSGSDLVAAGVLEQALEGNRSNFVSETDSHGRAAVPLLSFRTKHNTVCREYRLLSGESSRDFAGLACRNTDGAWRIAVHVETAKLPPPPPQDTQDYGTAFGPSNPSVDAVVDKMMAREAFGKEDERALLKNGWTMPTSPGP